MYVTLGYGDWKEKTAVQEGAGSDAAWSNLDFEFDVTKESIINTKMVLSVLDKNKARKDVVIATIDSVSLLLPGANIGKEMEINVNFGFNAKNRPIGRLSLFVTIIENPLDEKVTIAKDFIEGYLKITEVLAYNLRNTDFASEADPFIVFTLGSIIAKTNVLDNAGSNPIWDHQDIRFSISRSQLESEVLKIEAWDKDNVSDTFIGGGEIKIDKAGVVVNQEITLATFLTDKKGEKSGKVVIKTLVKENDLVIIPNSAKPIVLPDTFTKGVVCISCIQAYGVINTELFGKQDPFVTMKFTSLGNVTEYRTPTCKDKGGDVIWNEKDYKFVVTRDDILASNDIEIGLFDENKILANKFIGKGSLPLKRLANALGQILEVSVNISEKPGLTSTGRMVFQVEMKEGIPEVISQLPADFTNGILRVVRIRTFDLTNLEIIGKQDPYIKLFAGEYYEDKTYVQGDAGGDVLWDYLDMAIPVTKEFIVEQYLLLETWESNSAVDLLIGSSRVVLNTIAKLDTDYEISVILKDKKNKDAGKVTVFVRLEKPPPTEVKLPETFTVGTMFVRRICAFGLANKEILGKSDPYVLLTLQNWEGKTNSLPNQGANVIWDFLDLKTKITPEIIKNAKLNVTLMDKNDMRRDKLIGSGEVKLLRTGQHIDDAVLTELSTELKDDNGKSSGRVTIYAEVKTGEEIDEKDLKIPDTFKFGTLQITQIRSFDLKNTEFIGLPDPFVEVKIGDWKDKTYTKEEGGSDVLWNFLDLRCDVTDDLVKSVNMEIAVWDENKNSANTLIGNGMATLLRPGSTIGKEAEIPVSLIDNKGKFAGRLVLYVIINECDQSDGDVPESFQRGDLHVKRISAFSLKNTEFLGKQDPYVKFSLSDCLENARTKTLDNVGANPTWNYLDFHAIVNATVVKSEEIKVTIMDKNNMKDTVIGEAVIPIKKSGFHLEKDTELFGTVKDVKGKDAGRIVFLVNLHALPAEATEGILSGLPESFVNGIVQITKISAVGLKNKELLGLQVQSIT